MRKKLARNNHRKALLVFLAFLFAAVAVSAEPAAPGTASMPDGVTVSEMSAPVTADTAKPLADCDNGATEASFSNLVATPEDWQVQNASSCQYTCPQNLVLLCPSFPGYTTSCSSGCCVYSRACANQSCNAGEACPDIGALNGNCVDGCCVY